MRLSDRLFDILWKIKDFLRQPIIPIVTKEEVRGNEYHFSGRDKKYDYYWKGDLNEYFTGSFGTGKHVKVRREVV